MSENPKTDDRMREAAKALVATWPPLTEQQLARLGLLLRQRHTTPGDLPAVRRAA